MSPWIFLDFYSAWVGVGLLLFLIFIFPRMGFCRIFAREGNFKQPPQMEAPNDASDEASDRFRTAKEDYTKRLRRKVDGISIESGSSVILGAIFCGLIFVGGLALLGDGFVYTGVVVALFGALYFFVNLVYIPPGWKAVPFIFGRRNHQWSALFGEGFHWFPRPLIDGGLVDMRELTLDFENFRVIATGKVEGETRRAGVELDAAVQFRIWNPWTIFTVGLSVISDDEKSEGLKQLCGSVLREEASYRSIDTMLSDKRVVKQHIEFEADKRSDRWGVMVLDFPITRIVPTSQRVMDSYEKLTIEGQERPAEMLERDHVIDSVKRYKSELGIEDGEAALMAFDDTRGKARNRQRITFGGSGGGSLERTAATFGTVLGNALSNANRNRSEEESS